MSIVLPFYPPTTIPSRALQTAGPGTIARIVRLALQEWNYFGQEVSASGRTVRQGRSEIHRDVFERVGTFWEQGAGVSGRDGRTTVATASGKRIRPAWSAAFISFLMARAGVPDRYFPRSRRHMGYIHFAVNNQISRDPDEMFYGHRIGDYSPQVGDLVGYSRQDWVDYEAAIRQGKGESHTDLVVFAQRGRIGVIGGNVGNSVTLKLVDTDGRGRVVDRSHRWFVAIENRLPLT